MLTVKELEPQIFEVTRSGAVGTPDTDGMKRELTPAPEAPGKTGLVLRMESPQDMTGEALIADARSDFSMRPHRPKVGNVAVATDGQVSEALLNWFDPIEPMIAIRSFAPGKVAEAEARTADLPMGDLSEGRGARVFKGAANGRLVSGIDAKMSKEDVEEVRSVCDRAVATYDMVNPVVRIKNFGGFDPSPPDQPGEDCTGDLTP